MNTCQTCKTSFVPSAGNLACVCIGGSIITDTCVNIPGCLNAQVINGTVVCLFCDMTKNLILVNNAC